MQVKPSYDSIGDDLASRELTQLVVSRQQLPHVLKLQRVLKAIVVVLILRVTFGIVAGYRDYFPADFQSAFLWGREGYFSGAYGVAFYAHIVSGPLSLIFGLVLVSERVRARFLNVHRLLGKVQALLVLLVLSPSGLWMAFYAEPIAAVGFGLLAVGTGLCVALGWRAAMQRRLEVHRRWMERCFLLLCSAVILRLIGGLATVTNVGGEWSYPVAAWVSWLMPLAVFEWYSWQRKRQRLAGSRGSRTRVEPSIRSVASEAGGQSAPPVSISSPPAMEISARR